MNVKTKVILIGPPRSATTLVARALASHPQMTYKAFDENPDVSFGFEPFAFNLLGTPNTQISGTDDIQFMMKYAPINGVNKREEYLATLVKWYDKDRWKCIDHNPKRYINLLLKTMPLFKVLFHQVPFFHPVWQHLHSMRDLKVVLFRREYVDMIVSEQLAIRSNVWHLNVGEPPPKDEKIYIDPYYFLDRLRLFDDSYQFHTTLWNNRLMEFVYERDIEQWDQFIDTLEKFIGLKPMPLGKLEDKRTQESPRSLIANRTQLKKFVENGPWEYLFGRSWRGYI